MTPSGKAQAGDVIETQHGRWIVLMRKDKARGYDCYVKHEDTRAIRRLPNVHLMVAKGTWRIEERRR